MALSIDDFDPSRALNCIRPDDMPEFNGNVVALRFAFDASSRGAQVHAVEEPKASPARHFAQALGL